MNTLDLLFRIYRTRYSLDALQRRLERPLRLAFLGSDPHLGRMLHWIGELHPRAEMMPVTAMAWPDNPSELEEFDACVIHLGDEMPSVEWLREKADSVPDDIPCLWLVEGLEVALPDPELGNLPRVFKLNPVDPSPTFRRLLTRAFPGPALRLARDFSSFRQSYARHLIRHTAARNARMAVASSLKPPLIPVVGTVWRLFATTGETIAMTASQIHLCLVMAALHHRSLDFFDRMGELWPVIGSSFGWRSVARGLAGWIPVAGWLSKGTLAYSATVMVGEMSRLYYEYGAPQQEEVLREIRRKSERELARSLEEGEAPEGPSAEEDGDS